jgi:hypothetical protein
MLQLMNLHAKIRCLADVKDAALSMLLMYIKSLSASPSPSLTYMFCRRLKKSARNKKVLKKRNVNETRKIVVIRSVKRKRFALSIVCWFCCVCAFFLKVFFVVVGEREEGKEGTRGQRES